MSCELVAVPQFEGIASDTRLIWPVSSQIRTLAPLYSLRLALRGAYGNGAFFPRDTNSNPWFG